MWLLHWQFLWHWLPKLFLHCGKTQAAQLSKHSVGALESSAVRTHLVFRGALIRAQQKPEDHVLIHSSMKVLSNQLFLQAGWLGG